MPRRGASAHLVAEKPVALELTDAALGSGRALGGHREFLKTGCDHFDVGRHVFFFFFLLWEAWPSCTERALSWFPTLRFRFRIRGLVSKNWAVPQAALATSDFWFGSDCLPMGQICPDALKTAPGCRFLGS